MERLQTIETIPKEAIEKEEFTSASEVRVSPDGKFVYTGNRGHDTITVFLVGEDGRLSLVEREPTRVATPRNFNLTPSGKWLIAAGQDSHNLSVFAVEDNGELRYHRQIVALAFAHLRLVWTTIDRIKNAAGRASEFGGPMFPRHRIVRMVPLAARLSFNTLPMSADAQIEKLSLQLPPAPKPVGVYKPIVMAGNLAYLSGHGPLQTNKTIVTGRLGLDMDVEAGYDAARLTGLAILATLRASLGSLDRITRLVKLFGLVRCTDGFVDQPAVIDGASELFRDVFGEDNGVAARSAIGTNALPGGMAVEIETIFEVNA